MTPRDPSPRLPRCWRISNRQLVEKLFPRPSHRHGTPRPVCTQDRLSADVTHASITCNVCGDGRNDDYLLLCDTMDCEVATHTSCCMPRLRSVPVGNWYCAACTTRAHGQPRPAPNLQSQPPSRQFSVQHSAAGQLPGTPSTISMLATQEAGGGKRCISILRTQPIRIAHWLLSRNS